MASRPPRGRHQALRRRDRAERRLARRRRRRVLRHPRARPAPARRRLLRTIVGLEKPDDGRRLHRRRARHRRLARRPRHRDRVPEPRALPRQDRLRQPRLPAQAAQGAEGRDQASASSETAEMLHIEHLLDRKPGKLSGGERQRVALGRAIVRDPRAYLFDEPLSALDALLRLEMRTELKHLQRDLGRTLVYVTHDQVEAMSMADRDRRAARGRRPAGRAAGGHLPPARQPLRRDGRRQPADELPARRPRAWHERLARGSRTPSFARPAPRRRPRSASSTDGAACWLGVRPEDVHIDERRRRGIAAPPSTSPSRSAARRSSTSTSATASSRRSRRRRSPWSATSPSGRGSIRGACTSSTRRARRCSPPPAGRVQRGGGAGELRRAVTSAVWRSAPPSAYRQPMRRSAAAAGSAAFFAVAPGVVAGVVPWLLTGWDVRLAARFAPARGRPPDHRRRGGAPARLRPLRARGPRHARPRRPHRAPRGRRPLTTTSATRCTSPCWPASSGRRCCSASPRCSSTAGSSPPRSCRSSSSTRSPPWPAPSARSTSRRTARPYRAGGPA